jgi:hypothetical protein
MTTIRFSGELRDRIYRNASDVFKKQEDDAVDAVKPEWGDKIYYLMFQHTATRMAALPDGYFETTSMLRMSGAKYTTSAAGRNRFSWTRSTMIPLTTAMQKPYRMHADECGLAEGSYGYTINLDDSRWDSFAPEYIAYIEAIEEVAARKNEFVGGVTKVTGAYATLAPALKAWPPLWNLLPESAQRKHKEIAEKRVTKTAEDIGANLDAMTANVAMNRLLEGNK